MAFCLCCPGEATFREAFEAGREAGGERPTLIEQRHVVDVVPVKQVGLDFAQVSRRSLAQRDLSSWVLGRF